jgi:CRISPR-associated protein Csd1
MLLQKLKEYAETRMTLPPLLYAEAPVRYIIDLDEQGGLLNPQPIDTADRSNRGTERGVRRLVPQVTRTSGISPLLLADKADYTLGFVSERSKPERVAESHRQYLEMLERCEASTGEPTVHAVRLFLGSEPLNQLDLPQDFDPGALITFRVDGIFPVDLPAIQAFWAAEKDPGADPDKPPTVTQCLVCGQERAVLPSLQGNIKRVPGGQTSGTAIVSANAGAFLSYDLDSSLLAPICADCGEKFTKAANQLLVNTQTRLTLGNAAFTFWTREEVGFDFFGLMDNPTEEQVRELLASLRKGGGMPGVDNTAFYATSLSASGGRAVVRDWIDTTVGEAKRHLERWFWLQRIVGPYGEEARPLGLYALAAATVRDARQDLAPPTPRALLRAALTGTPLPSDLLFQAVRRNKAEQMITRQRAALIKMVLLSQRQNPEENEMVQLDQENKAPAYRCGRLLAVLEEAQKLALGNPNATIVDRFFGTASSAPASVFGRLLRGSQAHLGKLERDRPGAYVALQRRLEEILSGLDGFPRTLTLEEQGLFSLGYYHQRAFDRAQAREAAERRRDSKLSGVASPEAEAELDEARSELEEVAPK